VLDDGANTGIVIVYRLDLLILFWLPLLVGGLAFITLRRGLGDPARPVLCGAPRTADAAA
jgi:hypothetical protein